MLPVRTLRVIPNPFPFPFDPDNFDPYDIPLDLDPRLIPYLPTSPELRQEEKSKTETSETDNPNFHWFPTRGRQEWWWKLSREELADYIILLAQNIGLPDSIIEILIKYLQGTAGGLEMLRLLGYIEEIKELLRRIRDIDPSFFPFDIPDPEDLPFPFN